MHFPSRALARPQFLVLEAAPFGAWPLGLFSSLQLGYLSVLVKNSPPVFQIPGGWGRM